jgi:hypothetical protein
MLQLLPTTFRTDQEPFLEEAAVKLRSWIYFYSWSISLRLKKKSLMGLTYFSSNRETCCRGFGVFIEQFLVAVMRAATTNLKTSNVFEVLSNIVDMSSLD